MPIPSIPVTRLYGNFKYPDGTGVLGQIKLTTPQLLIDQTDDLFVVPSEYVDEVNQFFSADIPATDDSDWTTPNWKYTLTEIFPGGRTYQISAPYGGLTPGTPIGNNTYFSQITLALRTITGTYIDFQGNPISGSITFTLVGNYANTTGTTIYVPYPITATLDNSGTFQITLYATDTLPNGLVYQVSENFTNGRNYQIGLRRDNQSTLNIQTLAPAYPSQPSRISPIWQSNMTDQDEQTTILQNQYATYATNVPTQSTQITNNVAAVTTSTTNAYATISTIDDERVLPMMVNGA